MIFDGRSYSVLVISSSDKMNEALRSMLPSNSFSPVLFCGSIASAKRLLLEHSFDFVLINTPLPDDFGTSCAIDLCSNPNTVCLMFIKAELHEEIHSKVVDYGVFTLPRPTSATILKQGLSWMAAARERLRRMEKKTMSLEEKMEEIRLANRAKWLLIERLNMSESEAHHYIERQAMDRCITKREIAEDIIKTYQ